MEAVSRDPRPIDQAIAVGTAILLGALGILVGIVAVAVFAFALAAAGIDVTDRPLLGIVVSLISVQGVGLSVVGLAYLTITGRGLGFVRARLPTVRDGIWALGGLIAIFVLLFAAGLAIQAITAATDVETAQNSVTEVAQQDPTVLLLLIPAAFLIIGPAEELLFRGIIQGRLRQVFGPWFAIGIASLVFGFAHASALTGGSGGIGALLIPLVTLSLLSVVFGVTYELTENLVVPIFIHGAYDAVLFGLIYVVFAYGPGLETAANNSSGVLAVLF
ncbi:CPBP family intramembrane glutamic endopeptidase [Halomarina oriensis]|uniref:CPBP family intramembrane metalloprotease n=1 Tax=Halomarina oriensis TaxID=671145 RepID=A0A6B0GRJ4_9EURY|nr:CPBP family intramembrane glutamic endopeptidase [Halomarina oriensis]MWG35987.1 CPBP family intramembrane metalloprotease [Halomarina oriensis]